MSHIQGRKCLPAPRQAHISTYKTGESCLDILAMGLLAFTTSGLLANHQQGLLATKVKAEDPHNDRLKKQ